MGKAREVIESVTFGCFIIRGEEHSERHGARIGAGKDVRVVGKKVSRWKERKGHRLTPNMITGVYGEGVETLIIGCGFSEALVVEQTAIEDALRHGIMEVIVRPTPEACRLYNELHAKGTKVALLAHGTC